MIIKQNKISRLKTLHNSLNEDKNVFNTSPSEIDNMKQWIRFFLSF